MKIILYSTEQHQDYYKLYVCIHIYNIYLSMQINNSVDILNPRIVKIS